MLSTASLHTGYQFNVQFLRYFLAPIYEVHEVRQVGEQEILVKWSWTMNFWWNRFNPLRGLYDPRASPALRDFTALAMSGSLRDQSKGYCSCFRMLMLGLELSHQCRPLLQRLDSAGLQSQDRYAAIACAGLYHRFHGKYARHTCLPLLRSFHSRRQVE